MTFTMAARPEIIQEYCSRGRVRKYIVLDDGREILRTEISDEEYDALKYWGNIVREIDK